VHAAGTAGWLTAVLDVRQMLMNLHKKSWTYGLKVQRFEDHHQHNEKTVEVGLSSVHPGSPVPAILF
jgi:hypothetical protein